MRLGSPTLYPVERDKLSHPSELSVREVRAKQSGKVLSADLGGTGSARALL